MVYEDMWNCLRTKILEDLINLKTNQINDKDLNTLEYINKLMKEFEKESNYEC